MSPQDAFLKIEKKAFLELVGAKVDDVAPFIPALVNAAAQKEADGAQIWQVIGSHPLARKTWAYATLDYDEVAEQVKAQEGQRKDTTLKGAEGLDAQWDAWLHEEEDEVATFDKADDLHRAKLAILAVRSQASKLEKSDKQEQAGDLLWSQACLPELLCCLSIAAMKCQDLLSPTHVVNGLLASPLLVPLLSSILLNHPQILPPCTHLLAAAVAPPVFSLPQPGGAGGGTSSQQGRLEAGQKSTLRGSPVRSTPGGGQVSEPSSPGTQTSPKYVEAVEKLMLQICQLAPSCAQTVQDALLASGALPALTLHLTLEVLHDELDVLSRSVFSSSSNSLLLLYLAHTGGTGNAPPEAVSYFGGGQLPLLGGKKGTESLVGRVRRGLLNDAKKTIEVHGWCDHLNSHLRLFCALTRQLDLRPLNDEVQFWLKSLTSASSKNPKRVSDLQLTSGNPKRPNLGIIPKEDSKLKSESFRIIPEKTLELGFAFVCLVPGLATPSMKGLLHECVNGLLSAVGMEGGVERGEKRARDLAIWVAVHLLLRKFAEIAQMIRSALGIFVTVHHGSLRDVADAVTAAGPSFAETVARAAANLAPPEPPPKSPQRRGTVGRAPLTVECLLQLLQAGVFQRYGLNVTEIVIEHLRKVELPIHTYLPLLLQLFAEATFTSSPPPAPPRPPPSLSPMPPIPHQVLISLLSHILPDPSQIAQKSQHSFATAALTVYYILCREQVARSLGGGKEGGWWGELLGGLPLVQVIEVMERKRNEIGEFLAQFVPLATSLLPERFLPHCKKAPPSPPPKKSLVSRTSSSAFSESEALENILKNPTTLTSVLSKSREFPLAAVSILEYLISNWESTVWWREEKGKGMWQNRKILGRNKNVKIKEQPQERGESGGEEWGVEKAVIEGLVPVLLDERCEWRLQVLFRRWWISLPPHALPHLIPPIVFLTKSSEGPLTPPRSERATPTESFLSVPSWVSLQNDPLQVLSVNQRVFRTPPLLEIFLEILEELQAANRRLCLALSHSTGGNEGGPPGEEIMKKEEIATALLTQDSAAAQLLIEACLTSGNEERGVLQESRAVICRFLNRAFAQQPLLLKLVHFQGYPSVLIRVLIEHVPAMLGCLAFIPELLTQQLMDRQLFAINVAAELAVHHKTQQCLVAAQAVVAHVGNVQMSKSAGSSLFLQNVLVPLARCATVFPKECAQQALATIQACYQASCSLVPSGPCRDVGLQNASLAAFQELISRGIAKGWPEPLLGSSAGDEASPKCTNTLQ